MKTKAIFGPPGTGKTRRIITEVERLISEGISPESILLISHTKAATEELASRIQAPPGTKAWVGPTVATIHSIAYKAAGIIPQQVISPRHLAGFMEMFGVLFKGQRVDDSQIELGDEYLACYGFAVNRNISVQEAHSLRGSPGSQSHFLAFIDSYMHWKKMNGLVDFHDMLIRGVRSITFKPLKAILVDEAQDMSPLQWNMLDTLIKHSHPEEVIIVGDDDQAIFTWGGADPQGMTRWAEQEGAESETLTQSYRLPHKVLQFANGIIERIPGREFKHYLPTEVEGNIARAHGIDWLLIDPDRDTLLLYRTHFLRKEIERKLIDYFIPYMTLNGFPGMLDNRQAKAIRALTGEGEISKRDRSGLAQQLPPAYLTILNGKDGLQRLREMPWRRVLDMPFWMADYFEKVDVWAEPKIRLSTIHGAKGKEADHVILCNGMTERIAEEMENDPASELRVFYVGVTRAKQSLTILEGDQPHPYV